MNAQVNQLLDELGRLRLGWGSGGERPDRAAVAARIAAIEAELERANYQFHAVDVRG